MTVYVDTVLLLNTIINAILLYAAARLRAAPVKKWRLWCAASLGGVYAVVIYLPQLGFLQGWVFKILVGAAMVAVAFGLRREVLGTGLVFFAVSVVLCGLVFFVVTVLCGKKITGSGVYPVRFSELLLTAGLAYFCALVLWKRAAVSPREQFFEVRFLLRGRQLSFMALYDTGNSLQDPISGQGVDVIWVKALSNAIGERAVQAICREELQTAMDELRENRPRLIPYHSVGVAGGLLVAIRPTDYRINHKPQTDRLLALSPTRLNDSGAYTMIIGGKIHETPSHTKASAKADEAGKAYVYRRERCSAATPAGRGRADGH